MNRPYHAADSIGLPEGIRRLDYDAAGNVTQLGSLSFSYDNLGRLASAWDGTRLVGQYRYHPSGARLSKTTPTGTHRFAYGPNAELLWEQAPDGSVSEYFYLEGRPLLLFRGGQTYAIHPDHLGTPKVMYSSIFHFACSIHC